MIYQIILSPQVTITYKHGIYKLRQELTKDVILRILGNQEGSFLTSIEGSLGVQSPSQIESFVNTKTKIS